MKKRLRKIEDEEWRDVPNSNGRYMVSNYGRVKSFVFDKENGRIMSPAVLRNFYALKLHCNKVVYSWYIHKLVAEVFLPKPTSPDLTHVLHLDYNTRNNHVDNLKWVEKAKINEKNKLKYARSNKRRKPNNTKLKESDVALLKLMLLRGVTHVEIAKLFCISEMQVTRIKRGENWGHVKPMDKV